METVEEARARSAASRKAGIAERKRAAEIAEGKRKMSARDEEAAEVARKKKEAEIAKGCDCRGEEGFDSQGEKGLLNGPRFGGEKANPGGQGEVEAEPKQPRRRGSRRI
ncbi:unnamed protein product [Microthlaspi erraticum]|uniref:Uncharacterized protein n=1 Tax=Microthlaspi erraticum TaxID=1685480 RepID=A0A6D2J1U8_9BRAS|nr:unnamed protein product [Microthlaspi erraticum]